MWVRWITKCEDELKRENGWSDLPCSQAIRAATADEPLNHLLVQKNLKAKVDKDDTSGWFKPQNALYSRKGGAEKLQNFVKKKNSTPPTYMQPFLQLHLHLKLLHHANMSDQLIRRYLHSMSVLPSLKMNNTLNTTKNTGDFRPKSRARTLTPQELQLRYDCTSSSLALVHSTQTFTSWFMFTFTGNVHTNKARLQSQRNRNFFWHFLPPI